MFLYTISAILLYQFYCTLISANVASVCCVGVISRMENTINMKKKQQVLDWIQLADTQCYYDEDTSGLN